MRQLVSWQRINTVCGLVCALLVLHAVSVSAQPPPNALTLAWDPYPTSENVTGALASYVEVPASSTTCSTDSSGDTFVPVTPATSLSFTLTTLVPGRTYCLRAWAINNNGRSNASNTVGPVTIGATPDTTPPSAPASLSAIAASESRVNLSWSASTDNAGGIANYEILEQQVRVALVSGALTTHSITGLQTGSTHVYTVRAIDAAGNISTESPSAVVTTLGDTTAPSMPVNLIGTVTSNSANLSWQPSSDNVGVVGYRIGRNGSVLLVTSGLAHVDSGLSPNTPYAYTVAALDAAGNVSPLATVNLTTLAVPTPCTVDGKPYGITIQVTAWSKQVAPGLVGDVSFRLLNQFPITKVQAYLGPQIAGEVPIGAASGALDLRNMGGLTFSVPRTLGTYNLTVAATDDKGCRTVTTTARPLVVQ